MEITTIIGIFAAVIIILVGLRMLLRKPNDAAPSLESELHINADCQQPVIPRHVRDQLQIARAIPEQQRVEPNLNALDSVEIAEEKTQKLDSALQDTNPAQSTEVGSIKDIDQNAPAKTELHHKTDDAESKALDTTDLSEKTDENSSENIVESDKGVAEKEKEPAFQLNVNVETAEIKEFDEESNILDVHLNEQQKYDDESVLSKAETIIALNVYPNPRKALSGDKTLKMLLKYGLRFGELSCFHRYENPEEESHLLFSVLRVTDNGPDGFDLETLSTEQVQGLAFFLALPHSDVQKGFDTMVSIAGLIAREIDGTVYDENNLEFTPQLKEHWRHKAIDYRSGHDA
ncbi:cell division protein ZipA C-terminal FtsZ-binding domain-containing protein [Acinetobacter sp.]|uniref:cell division protein ZipA C-terminal FtsZ-binding domain-containing protein n=1 Tax=Acinetobacter sp. TaxID=472 RepID=UPI00258AAF8E|nr:cell division protein ZipA C-terminal FtsZ-binding domain-containing protein [Acinetobacter sp.]